MIPFTFEKLEVYQKAIAFADSIYDATKTFPKEERFGLISQLRRSSISIAANIAEGAGRQSKSDQKHFYTISRGSLYECIPFLELANRKCFLQSENHQKILSKAHELARLFNGLIRSRE
ncbi:MAG: hypothetical protein A2V67_07575 [Deltaproteobacteria bacterium RBG_13_61_14]|nr:MAG: hypothetical protein A2V67_07575 [Deltaproteobacteria bacterium RBG_13_61_14]